MRRIQFYLLKLGRHLNQKEEALCFVYVLYKCAIVYLKMFTRSLRSKKVWKSIAFTKDIKQLGDLVVSQIQPPYKNEKQLRFS